MVALPSATATRGASPSGELLPVKMLGSLLSECRSNEVARSMALEHPDTLTAAAAKHIRDAIVTGRFPPGSRLPEVALSKELNTSRGTVREAVRTLADGGLVEVVPRRGVFVSLISVRTMWEITSLRALLEPYAARLALEASGSEPAFVAEVREAFDSLRKAVATGDAILVADADIALHRALFSPCRHQMLLRQLDSLELLARRIVLANRRFTSDPQEIVRQHAPIVAAVEAGDPANLEIAVRWHVIDAAEMLLSRMAAAEHGKAARPRSVAAVYGRWPGPDDDAAEPHKG